jgi:hypothetical protein
MRNSFNVSAAADDTAAEVSSAPAAGYCGRLLPPSFRLRRGDAIAIAVLTVLPILVFGLPALLGHAVLPGDDLTQNYPLRVLVGRQIASGHLPLFNPYIWSGSPLLGDWNAGAAYPPTLFFAVLPGVAAWTLDLILTWVVAGVGMFCFLRSLRLAAAASFVGALSFAFAGAMSAQVGHIGLVAGMSWVPLQLLAVRRLTEQRSLSSRLGWISCLAATFGMTILAGEPRAIDDVAVLVVIYAIWQVARAARRRGPLVLSVVAGLGLGACLGAVQLLPGLAAISTSQRAASSFALYNSGSLSPRWLLLTLVPDLLGGSGSFGQPAFFATYQLAEVTSYIGILPLVAALALLARVRLRRPAPEWLVWHIVAVVGIVLALGGTTPLGHLFAHLPLLGSQRLQSRNILVADTALAVLLAYWADDPLGPVSRAASGIRHRWQRRWASPATVLGLLPPVAVALVAAIGIWWPRGLLGWLGVSSSAGRAAGSLASSIAPFALLAAAAIGLVVLGRRMSRQLRTRLTVAFVLADVITFTLLAVVAVDPGAGHSPAAASSAAQETLRERTSSTQVRPIGELGYPGRFAIYDPGLRYASDLPVLESPDLNVISATPSVQGYSSIVSGQYATATGSHRAMGDGQNVLSTRAIADGVLGQLNTSVLLTLPDYLISKATGHASPDAAATTGNRNVSAGEQGTWYLGTALRITGVTVPDSDAAADAAAGFQIGLTTPGGQTRWLSAEAVTSTSLSVRLRQPATAVAVVGRAGDKRAELGPPTVTEATGQNFVADGELQNALTPPQWGFAKFDGPFAVFVDHQAAGALTIQGLHGGSAAGSSVDTLAGAAAEPSGVAVQSAHGVRVTRAVAYIPGWTATWQPAAGQAQNLPVHRVGTVQAVDVPAGRGVVTWTYVPPRFALGLVLSLLALVLILAMAVRAWRAR